MFNNPVNLIDPPGLDVGACGYDAADPAANAGKGRYSSADAAAKAGMSNNNWNSRGKDKEYASEVYGNPDGTYGYNPPREGGQHSNYVNPSGVPPGTSYEGYWHTHGANSPGYDDNNFSPDDRKVADKYGKPAYVATPSNTMKKYSPGPAGTQGRGTESYMGKTPD